MLQRLERPDGDAELLSRLQVLERRVVGVANCAHRLRADERGGKVDHSFDQRQAVAGISDDRIGGDANAVERNVRRAQSVERAQRGERDAGSIALDDEQAQAFDIAVTTIGPRRRPGDPRRRRAGPRA